MILVTNRILQLLQDARGLSLLGEFYWVRSLLAKTQFIPPPGASSECIYPGFPPICASEHNPLTAVHTCCSRDIFTHVPPIASIIAFRAECPHHFIRSHLSSTFGTPFNPIIVVNFSHIPEVNSMSIVLPRTYGHSIWIGECLIKCCQSTRTIRALTIYFYYRTVMQIIVSNSS